MGFVDMWNKAIECDPYWQFEELLEEDPELAEVLWHKLRVATLAANKLGLSVSLVLEFMDNQVKEATNGN